MCSSKTSGKQEATCRKQLRTFEIKLDTSDLISKGLFHIKSHINMYCKHTCSPATVVLLSNNQRQHF